MVRKVALGGVLGGVVLFLWGFLSHTVIPWFALTYAAFEDEEAVTRVLEANAPENGVYLLPNPYRYEDLPAGEAAAKATAAHEGMFQGMAGWAVVRPRGFRAMGTTFALGFLQMAVTAAFVTWLVLRGGAKRYACRFGLVASLGVFGALASVLPGWVWMGFPGPYTAVLVADFVVGWCLVGAVLARVATPPAEGAPAPAA